MPKNFLFLDTAYIYALYNSRDQWHEYAVKWRQEIATEDSHLITTQLILVEIANGLSSVRFRQDAVNIIHAL